MAMTPPRDDPGSHTHSTETTPASKTGSRRWLWLVLAGLIAVFAPTMVWLWGRWTLSVWHNAHGLMIIPVAAYFVREELRATRHLPTSSSAWGFAILVP